MPAASQDLLLARDLGSMPRSMKRKEFMFLSSVLTPSSLAPAGRSETLASQRSEPSSMFTSETPSWRSVARSSFSHSLACSGERRSGSVTISTSGVPPRLKSTMLASEPWMRPLGADVDQLGGVLLEVHAVDAHVPRACPPRHSGSSYWEIW